MAVSPKKSLPEPANHNHRRANDILLKLQIDYIVIQIKLKLF
jgi:hypothetical protein